MTLPKTHQWNAEKGIYEPLPVTQCPPNRMPGKASSRPAEARTAYGATSSTVEAFAATYVPGTVRWLEPTEAVRVTTVESMPLANGMGVLASYRRDSNFSGNLSEAVKVIDYASGKRW